MLIFLRDTPLTTDLFFFQLKPYVSFRTPETADAPAITSRDLFQIFYADGVTESFKEGKYAKGVDSLIEQELGDRETRKKTMVEKGIPVLDDGSPYSVSPK